MTEPRRGRPPGSKNRMHGLASLGVEHVGPGSATVALTPAPPFLPHQPQWDVQSAPTIRVILSFRKAFGDESSEQEIEWPAAWRLPLQGERIHLSATFGGIVSTLDFDVERGLIVIHLR